MGGNGPGATATPGVITPTPQGGNGGVGGQVEPTPPPTPEPTPVPCTGNWSAGQGSGVVALRSDVSVDRVLTLPPNAVRLVKDPLSGNLLVLFQNGQVREVNGSSLNDRWSPGQMQIPNGNDALGMAAAPDGTIYVESHITADQSETNSRATIVRGVPDGSGNRNWSVFAQSDNYPRSNTYFDHEWSGLAVSADGQHLYVNCGSRTDHGEPQLGTRENALTAAVLRLPTGEATPLQIPNDENQLRQRGWLFAQGLRNSFDLEFAPNGDLLAGDNGPDGDYHEELNWIREGHHYGFPWRIGNEENAMSRQPYNPDSDPRLQAAYSSSGQNRAQYWFEDPAFPSRPSGVTFTEPMLNPGPDANQYRDPSNGQVRRASDTGQAFATFSDHGSPLGLTFDREGALCGEFSGKAFILRYGTAAGEEFERGRDLLFLDLQKVNDDYSLSTVRQLVRGFQAPIDAVLEGNQLYVIDRGLPAPGGGPFAPPPPPAEGALYRITLPSGQ